jgi:predicted permease
LLVFAFVVSVAAGVLSGFAPALQAGRGSIMSSLKDRAAIVVGGLRLRKSIVTAQIAFTLILVVGAALFVRTLNALLAKGPGFDTSSLISFGIDPVQNGYSPAEAARLIHRIHDEIRAARTTQDVAVVLNPLLTGGSWNNQMTIQTDQRIISDREVRLNAVSPEFFHTLGARIIAGRDFDEHDSLPGGPGHEGGRGAAIVNQSFVRRYFKSRSPLGAHIGLGAAPDVKPEIEIVGVMADISYRGVREESEQVYFPILGGEGAGGAVAGTFYIRIQGQAESAFRSIRTIVRNEDPTLPISYFRTLDEQVSRSLSTERMLAALSGSFGTLALALSIVGLYGVVSFTVTQRTREIGVRVALGATRFATVWLVFRDALIMTTSGIAIALPGVWALGKFVESQLYDVKPTDPATIVAATLLLCSTSLGAALIPAYRASTVNPADSLRLE